MVNGLEKFREKFEKFNDEYVVIGGTACSILMEDAGLKFRSTKDVDMVLVVDAQRYVEFGKTFWDFIKEGQYTCGEQKRAKTCFYRFTDPQVGYPSMIELLSKSTDPLVIPGDVRRVPIAEDVSSLSAIILDESYYNLLSEGCDVLNGIRVLKPEYLILYKMKARMNLKESKEKGEHVNTDDYRKHKNDVFRLLPLLSADLRIALPEKIQHDVETFLDSMKEEVIDSQILGDGMTKEEALDMLRKIFFDNPQNA